MSVATELTRILGLKAELLDNLDTMGVSLAPDATLEEMVDAVLTINTGDGAFVPGAFSSGNWTATADIGEIDLNITTLPSDNGTPITALQYRLDGGSAVNLAGTGTGARTISGLTPGVEYDVQIRAVNVLGAGAWSDTKSRTPTAEAGAPAAFTSGQWTLVADETSAILDILALPSDNGSALTSLQYRIDGGAAVTLPSTAIGDYELGPFTPGVEIDVDIRAVNGEGFGAWSDVKSVTPESGGGTPGDLSFGSNTADDAALVAGFFSQFGSFFSGPDELNVYTTKTTPDWQPTLLSPALAGNLPAGATVTAVYVDLYVISGTRWLNPTVHAHQCLRNVVVSPAVPNLTDYATGNAWAGQAGSGVGDRSASLSSALVPSSGLVTIPTSSGLVAALQAWADGSRANPFWFYIAATDSADGEFKVHGPGSGVADGSRPRVRVEYTA